MTELLRELLGAVFPARDTDEPVALAEAFDTSDVGASSSLRVSGDGLPEHFERVELPAGPAFLDAAVDYLSSQNPTRVALFAPLAPLAAPPAERRRGLTTAEALALAASEALAPGVQLTCIVPPSFLSSPDKSHHRAAMFQHCDPTLVVTHEHEWTSSLLPHGHAAMRLATLVVHVGKQEKPALRFLRLPVVTDGNCKPAIGGIRRLMKQGGGITDYGYILRELPQPGDILVHDAHHPEMVKRTASLEAFGSLQPLSAVAEVSAGSVDTIREGARLVSARNVAQQDGLAAVLESKHIQSENEPLMGEATHLIDTGEDELLHVGDLCVATRYGQSGDALRVRLMGSADLPAAAASSAIVVRPNADVADEDRQFLLDYLHSPLVMDYLRAQGMTIPLRADVLGELPTPVMDAELRNTWRDLNGVAAQFSTWAREATEYRDSLFKAGDAENTRLAILNTGRIAGLRHDAAARAMDFHHRVRTLYPHPVAYRWRIVEAGDGSLDAYQQILEAVETLTCYLACMALVALQSVEGVDIQYLDTIATRLTGIGHGTTFGDWSAIVEEANRSKDIAAVEHLLPFLEVFHFLDDAADEALLRTRGRRNAFAHGKGPKGEADTRDACEEARANLESLLRSAEFVADYPLFYIENTRWDSIRQVTHYQYRELMGDHPVAPLAEGQTQEQGIEAHSLYLVDRSQKLRLLRPYLTSRECVECGYREAFFLDTYAKKTGTCTLKSLERGHTHSDAGISDAFRAVGLLTS